jgi:FtsP/CotA-like multicopper oxidase with cupredoxin domain
MVMPYVFPNLSQRPLVLLLGTLAMLGSATANAQTCPGVCGGPLQNPVEWSSLSQPTLNFVQGQMALPGLANGPLAVQTRFFNMPGNKLLAGPTIRVKPGHPFTIPLDNQLPYQETDNPANPHLAMHDEPFASTVQHGFDVVNLHTHGLHVSPKDHADNVLLNLFPASSPKDTVHQCKQQVKGEAITHHVCAQGKWESKFHMPKAHASGTYWYHTHKHGAVALHLASGLSGALIVEDDKNGLESLPAVQNNIKYGRERVMLVQSLQFATPAKGGSDNQINCQTVYGNPVSCAGDPAMNGANAQLSLNGQFNSVITLYTGEAQLWRMVNTTVGNVLPVCFSAVTSGAPLPQSHVLAADGVPVKHPGNTPFILQPQPVFNVSKHGTDLASNEFQFLAPGQRLDLLVQAPTQAGWYALLGGPAVGSTAATPLQQLCPAALTAEQISQNAGNIVAWVQVLAPASGASFNQVIPTQAQLNQLYTPKAVAGAKDMPPSPTQGVVFGFTNVSYSPDKDGNPVKSKIGGASVVNGRPFYEGQVQRRLKLNKAERWGVQSAVDAHMFHIHTNSFQLMQRGNVAYPFPIWRDTVLINCSPAATQNVAAQGGIQNCAFQAGLTSQFYNTTQTPVTLSQTAYGEVVQFASRAVDYDGPIVMHCHNTGHEDNGMMELVEMFK